MVGAAPHRAVAAAGDAEFVETHLQCIVSEQAPDERLACTGDDLEGLGRLQRTEHAGQHAQHSRLGAVGDHGVRGLREYTPVARTPPGHIRHHLALETVDCRRYQRPLEDHAGVVDEVARCEPVGAIQHQVVVAEYLAHVGRLEFECVRDDANFRIETREPLAPGLGLRSAPRGRVEQHLTLQVGQIDAIAVEQAERAAAGGCQIQRRRRAEASGADDEYARRLELLLSGGADLREHKVTRVTFALGSRQRHALTRRKGRR